MRAGEPAEPILLLLAGGRSGSEAYGGAAGDSSLDSILSLALSVLVAALVPVNIDKVQLVVIGFVQSGLTRPRRAGKDDAWRLGIHGNSVAHLRAAV